MLFDWFTVLAQIVNFLILMWLLKRFLYKPVLNAIDAREMRIADLLTKTQLAQQQIEQQQAELKEKNVTFASEREALLVQAKAEAGSVKKQILNSASQELAQQRSLWLAGLQKEQHNLEHEINQRTQQEVLYVARRALLDLSDVDLETQITRMFIKKLAQLSPQQRKQFSTITQGGLVIRSAMPLADDNKKALEQAVTETLSAQLLSPLHFDVDLALVSGIEIVGSGHKLSWNINDYLLNLEDSISDLVDCNIVQGSRQSSSKGASDVGFK